MPGLRGEPAVTMTSSEFSFPDVQQHHFPAQGLLRDCLGGCFTDTAGANDADLVHAGFLVVVFARAEVYRG
jgi:hypothetical protein